MSNVEVCTQALENALAACAPYLDSHFVVNMRRKVRGVREREEWGSKTLVVTLCGGTGVGKSALFNAIARSHFSDSAPLRPTTRSPHVCLWDGAERRLATQLGAQERDVMAYDAALSGTHPFSRGGAAEAGEVKRHASIMLVDLPDTDSVEFSHGVRADQAMRESDVLVWVLDGQKYADHISHDNYLSRPQIRGKHLIVVLNQIDLIPFEDRGAVARDIQRLLDLDGTAGVPFFFTSATEGSGIAELEEYIASLDARAVADQARVATLAHDASTLEVVMEDHTHSTSQARMACADVFAQEARLTRETLLTLAGVERLARQLARGQASRADEVVQVEPASQMLVQASMESYVAVVCAAMPASWQERGRESVADADAVRRDMARALRTVPVPPVPRSSIAARLALVGSVVCVLAAVGALLALAGVDIMLNALGWVGTLGAALGLGQALSFAVFALVAALLAGGLWYLWRRSRGAQRTHSAATYREALRDAAGEVLELELFAPLAKVWDARAGALRHIDAVRAQAHVPTSRRAHVRH